MGPAPLGLIMPGLQDPMGRAGGSTQLSYDHAGFVGWAVSAITGPI